MKIYKSRINRNTLHGVKMFRCDGCGFWVNYDRPSGGQYYPDANASGANGGAGASNHYTGCPFCLTPGWKLGAKLGDLKKMFPKKSKGNRRKATVLS